MTSRMMQVPDELARLIEAAARQSMDLSVPRNFRQAGGMEVPGYEQFQVGEIEPIGDGRDPLFPLVDARNMHHMVLAARNFLDVDAQLELIGCLQDGENYINGIHKIKSPQLVKAGETGTFPYDADDPFFPWVTLRNSGPVGTSATDIPLPVATTGKLVLYAYIMRR